MATLKTLTVLTARFKTVHVIFAAGRPSISSGVPLFFLTSKRPQAVQSPRFAPLVKWVTPPHTFCCVHTNTGPARHHKVKAFSYIIDVLRTSLMNQKRRRSIFAFSSDAHVFQGYEPEHVFISRLDDNSGHPKDFSSTSITTWRCFEKEAH